MFFGVDISLNLSECTSLSEMEKLNSCFGMWLACDSPSFCFFLLTQFFSVNCLLCCHFYSIFRILGGNVIKFLNYTKQLLRQGLKESRHYFLWPLLMWTFLADEALCGACRFVHWLTDLLAEQVMTGEGSCPPQAAFALPALCQHPSVVAFPTKPHPNLGEASNNL